MTTYKPLPVYSAKIIWEPSVADPAHIVWITTSDGMQICADNYGRMPILARIELFFVRRAIKFLGKFINEHYKNYPQELREVNLKYNSHFSHLQ
jgi:hypothetical protein